jgi:hypothetical protein
MIAMITGRLRGQISSSRVALVRGGAAGDGLSLTLS